MDDPDEREMDRWSQEHLLREALGGNDEAFSALCVRVLPGLTRYLRYQCRRLDVPTDLAGDFAQETLLRAIGQFRSRKRDGSRPLPEVSAAWLNRIGYHIVVDWTRSHQRHQKAQSVLREATVAKPTRHQQDEREEVLKYCGWLPDNEREMIELVLLKDMHVLAAGNEMGLSEHASYKTYERALKHLRDLIQEHGSLSEQLARR